MLQGAKNKFTLTYLGSSTFFTPKNWREVEVLLTRDRLPVDQEVTLEFEIFGDAATVIETARTANANVTLTIEQQDNNWNYGNAWTFSSDMLTYKKKGRIVSLGFIENTCRDEIEKNKSTKYELDIPTELSLLYTGISRDKSNAIGTVWGNYETMRYSASNYIVHGVKTQSEQTDNWIFTDYDQRFYARALKANTTTISFLLRTANFHLNNRYDSVTIQLLHCRPVGASWKVMTTIYKKSKSSVSSFGTGYDYTFIDHISHEFVNNGTRWTDNGYNIVLPDGITSAPILLGDFIMLVVNCGGQSQAPYESEVLSNRITMTFNSSDVSVHVGYPISVVSSEWILEQLLAKMCSTSPTLTYNLPKYNESGYYVPVFTSGSALQHATNPKLSVSWDDMMQFLRCMYSADYDVSTVVTIDHADAFFSSTKAIDIEPVGTPEVETDTEHVYNTVEVGWETDTDVENGQDEILCRNVFKINSQVEDKKLDLVSPFKGSPYTIEQYLDDKADSTGKTKEQDNDVFVFCVVPFTSGVTTTLYKGHTGATDTYYNVPMTPMRFLIANSRYLGVSVYNLPKELTFISTDRKADETTTVQGESASVTENDGSDATLVAGLSNPLFVPETVKFDSIGRMTKSEIEDRKHKYFSVVDKKCNIMHNIYINDISLPLTEGKIVSWIGLKKYDV